MKFTKEEIEQINSKPINWGNVWIIIGIITLILFIGTAICGSHLTLK